MEHKNSMPIVFVDTETTGLDPEQDQPIQIAAIATTGFPHFAEISRINIKVTPEPKPKHRLLEGIKAGVIPVQYSDEEWTDSIGIREAALKFQAFIQPYKWISMTSKAGNTYTVAQVGGHNVNFDVDMLMSMGKRASVFMPFSFRGFDTLQYALNVDMFMNQSRPSYRLGELCNAYGIPLIHAHDALDDIEATVELAKALTHELKARLARKE